MLRKNNFQILQSSSTPVSTYPNSTSTSIFLTNSAQKVDNSINIDKDKERDRERLSPEDQYNQIQENIGYNLISTNDMLGRELLLWIDILNNYTKKLSIFNQMFHSKQSQKTIKDLNKTILEIRNGLSNTRLKSDEKAFMMKFKKAVNDYAKIEFADIGKFLI